MCLGLLMSRFFLALASKNIDGGIFAVLVWVVEHSISQSLRSPMELSRSKKLSCHLIPPSLGIETLGEDLQGLLISAVIPCMASRNITTPLDYPDSLSIRILQGEHQIASMNDLLGELKVERVLHTLLVGRTGVEMTGGSGTGDDWMR
ncbi:Chaperone protein DnaK [Camellia lanceoleosa]|uniref:Chaperone protein DnaK n=1 Tax=Camellia lanceoleosa TaxID=1840588 RepID=A0ACC0F701_9ERIC|nr:Chaperone protein DnaK [Camellia lanceoleosa]